MNLTKSPLKLDLITKVAISQKQRSEGYKGKLLKDVLRNIRAGINKGK